MENLKKLLTLFLLSNTVEENLKTLLDKHVILVFLCQTMKIEGNPMQTLTCQLSLLSGIQR